MSVKRYDFFVERTEIPEFSPTTSGYVTYEDYVKVRKERDVLKKQRDDYQATVAYFLAKIKTLDSGWVEANASIMAKKGISPETGDFEIPCICPETKIDPFCPKCSPAKNGWAVVSKKYDTVIFAMRDTERDAINCIWQNYKYYKNDDVMVRRTTFDEREQYLSNRFIKTQG
jgi:hypothetical protein